MESGIRINLTYIVLVIVHIAGITTGSSVGDECTLENGRPAECALIINCPEALVAIQHGVRPPTCGYVGTQPVVCCSNPKKGNGGTPKPDPTPTTTTTTTPRTKPPTDPLIKEPNFSGSVASQKCQEYAELIRVKEKPPILIIDKEEIDKIICGFEVKPLIVGGENATRREFPHMVLVGYDDNGEIKWKCAGTLISTNFVLTAGHCLFSRYFGPAAQARMGITNIDDPNKRQQYKIIDRISHPDYNPPSHYNDIGLLKLEQNVDFNPFVRPACLYVDRQVRTKKGVASGWGTTSYMGETSKHLLKVTLSLINHGSCNASYKSTSERKLENGILDDSQLCAGAPGKDTCQGDSGGPLQIYGTLKCTYEIIGVTSFGKACGIGESVGVYTRVSNYISWIEKNVWG